MGNAGAREILSGTGMTGADKYIQSSRDDSSQLSSSSQYLHGIPACEMYTISGESTSVPKADIAMMNPPRSTRTRTRSAPALQSISSHNSYQQSKCTSELEASASSGRAGAMGETIGHVTGHTTGSGACRLLL